MGKPGLIRARVVGIVAAVALATLSAACGDLASEQPAGGSADESAARPADSELSEVGAQTTDGGSGNIQALPSVTDRKIVRTATVVLSVEDVGGAVQLVENIALAAGGYVSGSNVFVDQSQDQQGSGDVRSPKRTQTATMTIRVPADAYGSVMNQLRGIAKEVVSERSEAQEVTEEYTDLQARLRNLQATEQRYLELQAKAETIPDILTVQDRLSLVRGEIEQVQGRINVLNDLTDLATIMVQLKPPALVVEEEDKGWAANAWETSWEGSKAAAVVLGTVAIGGAVLMAWLVPLAAVGFIGWRLFGRRLWRWAERSITSSVGETGK